MSEKIIDAVLALPTTTKSREVIVGNQCPSDYGYGPDFSSGDCDGACEECWSKDVDYILLTHELIVRYSVELPVIQDVDKRIGDWLASGGKPTDDYIKQQYRFVKNYIDCKR